MADYSLSDTIALMTSDDYKDRFKAEYFQTKLRMEKLSKILKAYDNGTLEFELSCPFWMLVRQHSLMYDYVGYLEFRAKIEGIDLTWQG